MVKIVLRRLAWCFAAAYIALLPQFYLIYNAENRFNLDWSSSVRASILISIAVLAGIYFLLYHLAVLVARAAGHVVRQAAFNQLVRYGAAWILIAIAFRSSMAIAVSSIGADTRAAGIIDSAFIKFGAYVFIPLLLFAVNRKVFIQWTARFYTLAGVMLLFLCGQMYSWKTYAEWSEGRTDGVTAEGVTQANSLYVFVFDCWSYPLSFGNPDFDMDEMPNLKKFMDQAAVFHNAYSPAMATYVSMLRFLFQADPNIRAASYEQLKEDVLRGRPIAHSKSIFDLGDQHYKLLIGSELHYQDFLGDRLNMYIPFYSMGSAITTGERVHKLLLTQVAFMRRFKIALFEKKLAFPSLNEWLAFSRREAQNRIRPLLADVLPRLPGRNLAFVHMMLPHVPYAFYRDWTPRERSGDVDVDGTYYLENIYACDAVIGDITRILKERGDFDSSLVIIMSDHGQRSTGPETWGQLDISPVMPEKHIPLIIKLPGQTKRFDYDQTVFTADLSPLFSDYLKTPETVRDWVKQQEGSGIKAEWYLTQ